MTIVSVTPVSAKAINNLGGRVSRSVEVLEIKGNKLLIRPYRVKENPNKAVAFWAERYVDIK